jgi:hypothetical protein
MVLALETKYDDPHSTFAFNLNLRCCSTDSANKLLAECKDGGPAQLKWRGRIMFWTGPSETAIEADVIAVGPGR